MRRISIAKAMILVAVVAVNIGVARMLYEYEDETAAATVPIGLLIQFGIVQAVRGRGRAFWIGFAVAAAACLATFVIARPDSDSALLRLWLGYTKYAIRWLNRMTHVWDYYNRTENEAVLVLTLSAVWTLPSLVIGLAVGVISWGLVRRFRERRA